MPVAKHRPNVLKSGKSKSKLRITVLQDSRTKVHKSLNLTLSNESFNFVRSDPQFIISVIERTAKTIISTKALHNVDEAIESIIKGSVKPSTLNDATQATEPVSDFPSLQVALDKARKRGQLKATEILNGSDMLTTDELARVLHLSRPAVNAQRQNGKLLGLEGAKRGHKFPKWQFDENERPYEGISKLSELLGEPWSVYRFLVQRHGALNGLTGLEALKRKNMKEVLAAAHTYGRDFS